jgi:hypothetical protein
MLGRLSLRGSSLRGSQPIPGIELSREGVLEEFVEELAKLTLR